MFYPLVIGISVVAYGDTDGIIGYPDALFAVNVDVVDGIPVHRVVPVVVGNNVWYGLISSSVHFVDAGSVCCNENFIVSVGTDAVDADIHQAGRYMHDFMFVQVIDKYSSLKSTDKNLTGRFVIV